MQTAIEDITIRELVENDLMEIKDIIELHELFPSEMLDEMVLPYLNGEPSETWFVAVNSVNQLVGVSYCVAEKMTEGTWNLLLLAAREKSQGIGSRLVNYIESYLLNISGRILIVETSSLPEFEQVCQFYAKKCGFQHIATIPEFYAIGDDKKIFYKKL